MLALVAGYVLVAYLLAPGAIYRLAFSFFIPSKRFQRSRTEEIVFSVLAVIMPLIACWGLLFHTPIGVFPHFRAAPAKTEAYREVFQNLLNDGHPSSMILAAYRRVVPEQMRFIFYLWVFCGVEGWVGGEIVTRYGSYAEKSWRKLFCDKFLLRHVSEWQVLFTTMTLPETQRSEIVEIDVLSSDTLYRGRLVNWFTDKDGSLAGIFLEDASRFQRDDWNRDKAAEKAKERELYWRVIPGAKLYITGPSITNYNIRYVSPRKPLEVLVRESFGQDATVTKLNEN